MRFDVCFCMHFDEACKKRSDTRENADKICSLISARRLSSYGVWRHRTARVRAWRWSRPMYVSEPRYTSQPCAPASPGALKRSSACIVWPGRGWTRLSAIISSSSASTSHLPRVNRRVRRPRVRLTASRRGSQAVARRPLCAPASLGPRLREARRERVPPSSLPADELDGYAPIGTRRELGGISRDGAPHVGERARDFEECVEVGGPHLSAQPAA